MAAKMKISDIKNRADVQKFRDEVLSPMDRGPAKKKLRRALRDKMDSISKAENKAIKKS